MPADVVCPAPATSAVACLMLETASTPGTPATARALGAGIEPVPSRFTIA